MGAEKQRSKVTVDSRDSPTCLGPAPLQFHHPQHQVLVQPLGGVPADGDEGGGHRNWEQHDFQWLKNNL